MRSSIAVLVFAGAVAVAEARTYFREYRDASDEAVMARVEARDPDAIRELGYRDIANEERILEKYAQETEPPQAEIDRRAKGNRKRAAKIRELLKPKYRNASLAAKMVLAKRGDKSALKHFVTCLSSAGGFDREVCIQALGYAGDKRAIRYLVPLLSEKGGPEAPSAHVLTEPFSATATESLSKILPDVARQVMSSPESDKSKAWLRWWNEHHNEYQEGVE